MNARTLPLLALLAAVASAETPPPEPLRYAAGPGDTITYAAHFSSETVVRRGQSVERLVWTRAGSQKVLGVARENGRVLFAVETEQGPARATVYTVDGQDRLKAESERLKSAVPAADADVDFLWLDDRGRGAPVPRDASLEEAVLRALDEIEILPEGTAPAWNGEGTVGPVTWKADFSLAGNQVKGDFTLATPERGGARVLFDPCKARLSVIGGWIRSLEVTASWTVATKDGTEHREVRFSLTGRPGTAVDAADAKDAAADAAPLIAAQEAWREGERDRALELWDKAAADASNRWADKIKVHAAGVRRDLPMVGLQAPALKAPAWIGEAPAAGRWQLVYFWGTWIPRCEPEVQALAALLKGRTRVAGAAVTRADTLQSEDDIRRAASKLALPFGVALDDGSLVKGFKVEDLPRVFLVDPDGRVRFEGSGSEVETLKALMDRLAPE